MNASNSVIASTEYLPDGKYVAIRGDIDLSRSPELRQVLLAMAKEKPARLIVDLADVPYMDSSGVATLVETLQAQRKGGGKMVLCNLQPKVMSIFEIARLNMVFTIVADRDAAMQA